MTIEHLKSDLSELKCTTRVKYKHTTSIKYIQDVEDLHFFFLMWDIYNSFLYWSQVGSAYSDLKQSLDSQPAIEVGSWQRESWIPAPKSVVSDKAPGPSVLQKIIPIKIESSEKSKVFIRKKKYSTCRQTQNHFNGAFPPGFLWPIILLCLVLSLYLVYFRILPSRRVPLSAKMDSREEAYG